MASIRKRTWKSSGIEQTAWVVDYKDQGGKRALKTFAAKKDAEAWKVNALHEVQFGTHTRASASKTVTEVWGLWLEQCKADNLEFSTIRGRRQHLKVHVERCIGAIRLSDLTTPLLYDFDSKLRDKGCSIVMRRKIITSLKTMLTFAQRRGLVAQNVALAVRIKSDIRESSRGPLRVGVDFPSMAELNSLIENSSARRRPFIVTAIFTGMRLSELRGLRWSDVDLDAGTIHVRQRADLWGHIGPPKSKAGKRDIPLAPIVVNTLKQWRTDCPKGEIDLVFPNGRGKIERMSNIHEHAWYPLQIKCGLTVDTGRKDAEGNSILSHRYGFHMLRHAAASLFIAYLGWTPKRLQTVMGHSSINMTFDLYGHLFENIEADRAAMAKFEAAVRAA
jgi:integrase